MISIVRTREVEPVNRFLVLVLHYQYLALGKPFSISELWSSHLKSEQYFLGNFLTRGPALHFVACQLTLAWLRYFPHAIFVSADLSQDSLIIL